MSDRIRLGLLVALLSAPVLANGDIYQCIEKGVTKFSQTPCGEIPSQSTLYQPKAPAMLLSHSASLQNTVSSPSMARPDTGFIQVNSVRIDDEVCEILSVNGRYAGTLENSSKTQSYEVKLEVRFDYEKSGVVSPNWDHRSQLFHLKPRQSQSFSFETRTLPPDSEITCKPEMTGRSLAGG